MAPNSYTCAHLITDSKSGASRNCKLGATKMLGDKTYCAKHYNSALSTNVVSYTSTDAVSYASTTQNSNSSPHPATPGPRSTSHSQVSNSLFCDDSISPTVSVERPVPHSSVTRSSNHPVSRSQSVFSLPHAVPCPYRFQRGANKGNKCQVLTNHESGFCPAHKQYANHPSQISPPNTLSLSVNPTLSTSGANPISNKLQLEIEREQRLLSTHQAKLQKAQQEYSTYISQAERIAHLEAQVADLTAQLSQVSLFRG